MTLLAAEQNRFGSWQQREHCRAAFPTKKAPNRSHTLQIRLFFSTFPLYKRHTFRRQKSYMRSERLR